MTPKFNVLFLCIGNACRSQMAEGFARAYGRDVMDARSAGLAPASMVPADTKSVMAEKGVDLSDAFPKGLSELRAFRPDLVVNMSGERFSASGIEVQDWKVADPYRGPLDLYRRTRDDIEQRVMALILSMRKRAGGPSR